MYMTEELQSKWAPVLEHPELEAIKDPYKRAVTALVLENQHQAMKQDRQALNETADSGPTNVTGAGVSNFDPILISLVRRSLPNLIAYDIAGVQPMTGPTGLIFAMRAKYNAMTGGTSSEAFYNEANTIFTGASSSATHTVLLVTTQLIQLTLLFVTRHLIHSQLVLACQQLLLNSWVQIAVSLSNKWPSQSRKLLLQLNHVH